MRGLETPGNSHNGNTDDGLAGTWVVAPVEPTLVATSGLVSSENPYGIRAD
jgi:hypothetical protein